MKNIISFFGIILLAVFYSLYIAVVNSNTINSNFTNKSFTEKEESYLIVPVNQISNNLQAEGRIKLSNNSLPGFKNPVKEFSAILKCAEKQNVNEFKQYTSFYINFYFKFSKINIIFPFHYFW